MDQGFNVLPILQQVPLWALLLLIAQISWSKFEKSKKEQNERLKSIEVDVNQIKLTVAAAVPEIHQRFASLEKSKDQFELDVRELRATSLRKPFRRDP